MKSTLEGEFRDIYLVWRHYAIPPLNHMRLGKEFLVGGLGNANLTDTQRKTLTYISHIAFRIGDNWRRVEEYLASRNYSQEVILHLFSTWWSFETLFLNKALESINDLLEFDKLNLTDEPNKILGLMQRGCYYATDDWRHALEYVQGYYGFKDSWDNWQAISLTDAINQAMSYLDEFFEIDNVKVILPNSLPPVKGNSWLVRAISNMVSCMHELTLHGYLFRSNEFALYHIKENFQPIITASLNEDSKIVIQIQVGLAADTGEQKEFQLNSALFSPGTRLSLAGYIIERYDKQAKFYWSNQHSEFQFTLSLWDGS